MLLRDMIGMCRTAGRRVIMVFMYIELTFFLVHLEGAQYAFPIFLAVQWVAARSACLGSQSRTASLTVPGGVAS